MSIERRFAAARPRHFRSILAMLGLPVLAACGVTGPSDYDLAMLDERCEAPRPEVCTKEYRPVCGLRDTGVPCVTLPCPAEDWKTYGNACTACSIPVVVGYRFGECDESEPELD